MEYAGPGIDCGGTSLFVYNSLIRMNYSKKPVKSGKGYGGGGVLCDSCVIKSSTIDGNSASGSGFGGGVYTKNGHVINNVITNNTAYSGSAVFGYGATVTKNTIKKNNGTYVLDSPKLIENNLISENNGTAVLVGSGEVVKHNTITKNKGNGIYCTSSSSTSPSVSYNIITHNTGIGVYYKPSVLHKNNIHDNGTYDVQTKHGKGTDVTAGSNYWGSKTTAEMKTKGSTANISRIHDFYDDFNLGKVVYSGWLTSPEPTAGPK